MTDDDPKSEPSSPRRDRGVGTPKAGHIALVLVLLGAAALAARAPQASPGLAQPPPAQANTSGPAPNADADFDEPAAESHEITGRVVERIDVPKYTYLSLDRGEGQARTWAAVSSAPVEVGATVRIVDAQLMTGFVSSALKRTFDAIYFGALADGADSPAPGTGLGTGANPHAGIPGAPQLGSQAFGDAQQNPHGSPSTTGKNPIVGRVVKAEGPMGRTVAETYAARKELSGQKIRVRGVVVKVTAGVLERSFVHVKDGSESAAVPDLLVTTRAVPAVGERLLFEGKVTTEKDFGAGYTYPVLLEDADVVDGAQAVGTRL